MLLWQSWTVSWSGPGSGRPKVPIAGRSGIVAKVLGNGANCSEYLRYVGDDDACVALGEDSVVVDVPKCE